MFKLIKIGLVVLLAMCTLGMGCSVKNTARTLIEKSYTVCTDAEKVVLKASTAEFVSTMLLVQTPLKIVNSVLVFIDLKITDVKVKEVIAKAITAIGKINGIIDGLTPEKVDQAKGQILTSLAEVKESLKFIGQYVGAKFPPDVAVAVNTAISSLTDNLNKSAVDLEKAFNKVK